MKHQTATLETCCSRSYSLPIISASTMKTTTALLAGLLLVEISAFAADADLKATVAAAAKKLADQSRYQWKTTVRSEGGGPFGGSPATTTGQIEKDGYAFVSSTGPQSNLEFARKAGKVAVVLEGNWMTLEQAVARSPAGGRGGGPFGGGGFNSGTVTDFKMPIAQVEELLGTATSFTKDGNTVTAELSADVVNELMNASTPFG